MTPDAQHRMQVYQEGQRAAGSGAICPYTDWRAKTWEKGRIAAREYYERCLAEASEPFPPPASDPVPVEGEREVIDAMKTLTGPVRLLAEIVNLCAIGDVDETTEAYGWGEVIKEAKAYIAAEQPEAPTAAPLTDEEIEKIAYESVPPYGAVPNRKRDCLLFARALLAAAHPPARSGAGSDEGGQR